MGIDNYIPKHDFSADQARNPSARMDGGAVDVEFANIAQTLSQTRLAIGQIRRDDGKLANLSVHKDSLSQEVLALLNAGAWNVRGPWVATTAYAAGDVAGYNRASYYCLASHTSGQSFAADEANWLILASTTATDAQTHVETFSGDSVNRNFTLGIELGDEGAVFLLAIGGVVQHPGADFTLTGDALTFTQAPPTGTDNILVVGAGGQYANVLAATNAARDEAEVAKNQAETARDQANQHKTGSDTARAASVAAKDEAVLAKNAAEAAKLGAETAKTAAEAATPPFNGGDFALSFETQPNQAFTEPLGALTYSGTMIAPLNTNPKATVLTGDVTINAPTGSAGKYTHAKWIITNTGGHSVARGTGWANEWTPPTASKWVLEVETDGVDVIATAREWKP